MSRALGPRPSLAPGGTAAGWAVLVTCWGLAALAALIWAAARTASRSSSRSTGPERDLYDTDPKFESFSEWSARNSGGDPR